MLPSHTLHCTQPSIIIVHFNWVVKNRIPTMGFFMNWDNGIYITNNMRNMFPPVYSNLRNFFRCCQARKAVVSERSPENDLTNFLTCGHSSHISGGPYCWTLTMLSSWIQRPPRFSSRKVGDYAQDDVQVSHKKGFLLCIA